MEQTYFRKGFGLKSQVRPAIDGEYHSRLVDRIRARGYADVFGDVNDPPGSGVRLLLRRRPGDRLPRQAHPPGQGDHPQPAWYLMVRDMSEAEIVCDAVEAMMARPPDMVARDWLPEGPFEIVTAGASTPNNRIGEALARLLAIRGVLPGAHTVQPTGNGDDMDERSGQLPHRAERAGVP